MEKVIFDKENKICQELSHKNGGKCNWGECDKCGVIPLLHKLYSGEIVENEENVKKLRKEILNS